jgi:hypothetical protein
MSENPAFSEVPYAKACPRCGRDVGVSSTYFLADAPETVDDTINPNAPMLMIGFKHDTLCSECAKEL